MHSDSVASAHSTRTCTHRLCSQHAAETEHAALLERAQPELQQLQVLQAALGISLAHAPRPLAATLDVAVG